MATMGGDRQVQSGDRGPRARRWWSAALSLFCAVLALFTWAGGAPGVTIAQEQVRTVNLSAQRYAFRPNTVEVRQDELVRVVLHSEDVAHSFTVDEYRIAKRVGPRQTVNFEFRADRPGRFTFYCNLKSDDGCREMRGTLVVHPR